jgi:cellulose synthase/poly-beta-1,6-N-acetylglucosamine synthase-like glycosyltransferase
VVRPDSSTPFAKKPSTKETELSLSSTDLNEKLTQVDASAKPKRVGFFTSLYLKWRAAYWPLEEPALVMPTPPDDKEKRSYLHTNRIPLYIVGVFAFLSLSVGMWLFTVSSSYFYWFAFFTFFLQFYLFISYIVGCVGKDFDMRYHERALENFPLMEKTAPTIDVYLPVCAEPLEVVENTWKYVAQMVYPGQMQIYVLDDGNKEAVKTLATRFGFHYIVRDDRPRLKKAGNLRWAFARTKGDYFVIFDADFCPRWDFLLEIIPEHLADPKTALVQTPQYFRVVKEQTWVEKGAGATQELFYRVVQVNRNRWGASICVGSNAVYRRAAFEEVGGTAEIGFSEDVHSG